MAEVNFGNPRSFSIGEGFLDRQGWTVVGTNVIAQVIQRIKKQRRNVSDASAKPYSTKGPIYIPLTGRGRTKRSLGGREVITKGDIKRSRDFHFGAGQAAGFVNSLGGGKTLRAPTPFGQVTPSGKSIKFKNYSDYKKFLGKSGERDLELSGKMLNAIDILSLSDNGVVVGFKDAKQAEKMAGNINIDDEWGLSPSDRKVLLDEIETEGLRRIKEHF